MLLVDPDTMAALHQQWMDLPGPDRRHGLPDGRRRRRRPSASTRRRRPGTDENPGEAMLGDVVLCPEVAADQAASAGHSTEAELHLLCTHGILHLLGYDHGEPDEEREMFELQASLARRLGQGERARPDPRAAARHRRRGPRRPPSRGPHRGSADRSRMTCRRRRDPSSRSCLVPVGGLFACVDSALARVSKARAEEFVREDVAGAPRRWPSSCDDRARYTNLLLLLRVACELTATVLVTIVARARVRHALAGAAAHRPAHDRHLLRRDRGRAAHARPAARQPRRAAPARAAVRAAGPRCSTRSRRC